MISLLIALMLSPITPDHLRPIPTNIPNPIRSTLENRLKWTTPNDTLPEDASRQFPWPIPITLILLYLIYTSPKKFKVKTQNKDPKKVALSSLKELPKETKPFYSKLSSIIRLYIENRLKIPAQSLTSLELKQKMEPNELLSLLEKCERYQFTEKPPENPPLEDDLQKAHKEIEKSE
ncbi:MAG: hypothetical protein WDZ27_01480, partial [Waddliaceae bacterium]